jgi:hypothetical protein
MDQDARTPGSQRDVRLCELALNTGASCAVRARDGGPLRRQRIEHHLHDGTTHRRLGALDSNDKALNEMIGKLIASIQKPAPTTARPRVQAAPGTV